MSDQLTREQRDRGVRSGVKAEAPPTTSDSKSVPGRFRFDQSRWWQWARRALAGLMVLVAVASWLTAQTYALLLVVPIGVVLATLLQRLLAWIQGRLNVRFVTRPLDVENRRYLAQFALRALLAGLAVASARLAIPRIEAAGLPAYRTQMLLVAGPLLVFVLLQLIPSRPVSRSLNLAAVIVVAFLSFQLVQINFWSGTDDAVAIAAPFEGEWYISSGGRSTLINHHYTPLADQRYAIDLVIERNGRTYEGDKNDLASYYCWDQPILAPADGVVVVVENGLQDWPVGQSDPLHAAGNGVVIDIGDGLFVQFAHLRMGSVPVTEGQQVAVGDVVGRCGNSGNTAEPHLHMQVQDSPKSVNQHQLDAMQGELQTFPFRFTDATHIRAGTEYPEQQSQLRRNDRIRTET